MPLRSLLNLGYAVLTEGMEPERRDVLDRRLKEKFDHEMTPEELKREQARRMLEAKGQPVASPTDVMGWMQRG